MQIHIQKPTHELNNKTWLKRTLQFAQLFQHTVCSGHLRH